MKSERQRYGVNWFTFSIIGYLSTLALLAITAIPAIAETKYDSTRSHAITKSSSTVPQAIANLQQGQQRWLEVDLSSQRLIAWQGDTQIYAVVVSTGTDVDPTLPGVFAIQSKHETARMQGEGYDVPDVPFTMYYDGNYAIHGAYWHQSFGTQVSRGCVNVAVNHAEWFFSWASVGTPVIVHY
ncbi:MAG: L,D-transpeptidase [Merismopedia sp. SIO2A8]|nr:L,D-transpeptidase [Merismopedia sp. SIO2A8]